MSEHDDRMRRLLEAEPTTSCEKWAAAKIRELEAQIRSLSQNRWTEDGWSDDQHPFIREAMSKRASEIAKAQTDGLEMAVRMLDKHGFTEAAARVQALLDGAFI